MRRYKPKRKIYNLFFLSRSRMKNDAMQRMKKKRFESTESLMRARRRGASSETSIDHNVTPDQEKKVEPAAGSRQRLCGREAEAVSVKGVRIADASRYGNQSWEGTISSKLL